MDQFEKISVPQFIWYLVPGLGLIFFLVFPLLVFKPQAIKSFIDALGPLGTLILGIILGFFLDGLRLYRFRPKYDRIKADFFNELKKEVAPDLDPYLILSQVTEHARKKGIPGISFRHAIWIMLGDFAILSLFEAVFWLVAVIYLYVHPDRPTFLFGKEASWMITICSCGGFFLLFVLVYLRFLFISVEEQKTTNRMFADFARANRDEIREGPNSRPGVRIEVSH